MTLKVNFRPQPTCDDVEQACDNLATVSQPISLHYLGLPQKVFRTNRSFTKTARLPRTRQCEVPSHATVTPPLIGILLIEPLRTPIDM